MSDWGASGLEFGLPSLAAQLGGKGAQGAQRRSVCVDDALSWAYRTELPKMAADRVEPVAEIGSDVFAMLRALGTRVDVCGSNDGFAMVGWDGPPHADALTIAAAVSRLDEMGLIDVAGIDYLSEPAFGMLTPSERAAAHEVGAAMVWSPDGMLRASIAAQVATAAVLGRVNPPATGGVPTRQVVKRHGKPAWFRRIKRVEGIGQTVADVEVDGYNQRRQRPYPGAYRKTWLSPDPAPIVAERIEYQIWRAALDVLRADLAGRLETFDVEPSRSPWWPWETGSANKASAARVLECEKGRRANADAA